jgi:hypothetical protein
VRTAIPEELDHFDLAGLGLDRLRRIDLAVLELLGSRGERQEEQGCEEKRNQFSHGPTVTP